MAQRIDSRSCTASVPGTIPAVVEYFFHLLAMGYGLRLGLGLGLVIVFTLSFLTYSLKYFFPLVSSLALTTFGAEYCLTHGITHHPPKTDTTCSAVPLRQLSCLLYENCAVIVCMIHWISLFMFSLHITLMLLSLHRLHCRCRSPLCQPPAMWKWHCSCTYKKWYISIVILQSDIAF